MMRGELSLPEAAPVAVEKGPGGGWETSLPPPPTEAELRKIEKQHKKEMEKKEQEEKEKRKEAIKSIEQGEKDAKKRLKALKKELEELDLLKEKAWDELTDEDEEALEGEVGLREELAKLEKQLEGKL